MTRGRWPWRGAVALAGASCALMSALAARAEDTAIAVPAPPPPAALPAAPASTDDDASPAPRRLLVMMHLPTPHARLDGGYGGGYGDAVQRRGIERTAARIAASHGLGLVSQWTMPVLGLACVVMSLPAGHPMDEAIRQLQAHDEVAWAQPDQRFRAQEAPGPRGHDDPLWPLQPVATLWRLDVLHAATTGRHVRVALIDSGVDDAHPDLARQLDARENFVAGQAYRAERHGTAVAGLVAARADNGQGIVGVAPDARLVSLRACWQEGDGAAAPTVCDSLSLAKALHHAIQHSADILNMSLSGPADPLLGRLIDAALERHQQVVAAVDPAAPGGGFPAGHPGVIAVRDAAGGPPSAGAPAAWCAPARDLPAPVPGGGWRLVSGTSYAAAEVSGLLALLRQARADAQAGEAHPASLPPPALVRTGDGGIDACASLASAAPPGGTPRVAACRPADPRPAIAMPGVATR